MTDLANRNAIITGAGQGLGLAIAKAYVAAGASVLLCARSERDLAEAQRLVAVNAGARQIVHVEPADVSRPEDVARLAAKAFEIFPQVHVLVNNAGIYGPIGPT
jgi:3-oxoacyl-[acyl-carrier protein] reductase